MNNNNQQQQQQLLNLNNNNNNNYNPFATGLASSQNVVPPSFTGANPFASANNTPPPNPFQAQQAPKPSMNQMRTQQGMGAPSPTNTGGAWGVQQNNFLSNNQQEENPFLV